MTLAQIIAEARLNVARAQQFLNVTDEPNRELLHDIVDELLLAANQIRRAHIVLEEGRDPL